MDDRSFPTDFAIEAVKGTPPVAIAAATFILGLPLDQWVMVATLFYVVLQSAFLIWRWRQAIKGKPVAED